MKRTVLTVVVAALAWSVTRAETDVRLPGLVVHGDSAPSIEASGKISLTNGILEFVAVEAGGRDYESLLTLDCKPSVLQSALLLIGCETGAVRQTAANARTGTLLTLEVAWIADGKPRRAPVASLLLDRTTQTSPAPLSWIFNGSYFIKHPITSNTVFLADEERAHVALWWQPSIPINLGGDYGNPYKAGARGLEANPATVPPHGTPITLILRPRAPAAETKGISK